LKTSKTKLITGKDFVEILRDVLDKQADFRFQAKGFSMMPFIKDGDVLTISPLSGVSVKLADVLAVINPKTEKLTVHRAVGIKKCCVFLQGDNLPFPDGFIPKENILGRVTKVERQGRKVFLGFGLERYTIVLLSRMRILYPLLFMTRRILNQRNKSV